MLLRKVLVNFICLKLQIREEFLNRPADYAEGGQPDSNYVRHGKNFPDLADKIVWASQLEERVAEYLHLAEYALYDITNCKQLKEVGRKMRQRSTHSMIFWIMSILLHRNLRP